jgi:hypothetical protein
MSIVRTTRKRFAVSRARSQISFFNFVVDMLAAKPRPTLRGRSVLPAVGAKEDDSSESLAAGRMPELTDWAPTVTVVDATLGVSNGVAVGWQFVTCVEDFGTLADFGMFIGFAVKVFKGAKFDVLQRSNLARYTV